MHHLLIVFTLLSCSLLAQAAMAVSFTADAVRIRGNEVSEARLYWRDGQMRFEYLDDGVPVAQIYDMKKNRLIMLDQENRLYLEQPMPAEDRIQVVRKQNKTFDPCKQFPKAECLHLKEATIKGRKTDKWLLTLNHDGNDYHIFQWVDKKFKTVVRQESSDGSLITIDITENQKVNGRKVRKLEMNAWAASGAHVHGIQWYDDSLDIVVRQQFGDEFVDELRNIKVGKVKQAMFEVPEGYSAVDAPLETARQMEALLKSSLNHVTQH